MLLIEDLEPPIRQLIFRLRYLQEKSYQEVADEVDVYKRQYIGGVAEHGYLYSWEVLLAEFHRIFHDSLEVWRCV